MAWRLLSASVPASLDDEIASVLGTGSLGVEIVPSGAGVSLLRVYLGQGDDPQAWHLRAARILEAHGLPTDGVSLTIDDVSDGRWVETWQRALAPIPLGTRFVVLPHEGLVGEAGRDPIRLVPGMAFGTGEHPTTRMCAAALESRVRPGSRWLDLGCGTGLLAIVAARCGAARVDALDLDPEAAHVASEVVAVNGLAGRIAVGAGSLEEAAGPFDGIVANIQASFFLARAQDLADALAPGGTLAISGFVVDDVPEIEGALTEARLTTVERQAVDPWACVVARCSEP